MSEQAQIEQGELQTDEGYVDDVVSSMDSDFFDEAASAIDGEQEGGEKSDDEPEASADAEGEASEDEETKEGEQKADSGEQGEEDESVARGWAAIKRQDKALREARQQLKAEREELESLKQELTQHKESEAGLAQKIKNDPIAALKELGFSQSDIAHRILHDGKPSNDEQARRSTEQQKSEKQELMERIEQLENLIQNQTTSKQHEQIRQQVRQQIGQVLENADDDYPFLSESQTAQQDVFDLISEWANVHGEMLQPREAADILEGTLRDQAKQLSNSKAFRSLIGQSDGQAQQQTGSGPSKNPKKEAASGPKTLTNDWSASPKSTSSFDPAELDEDELIQRAAQFLE